MAMIEARRPEDFERDVLRSEGDTVVLFWAPWCPFCQAFRPVFDAVVQRYDARFAVVWLDADDNPLWDQYRVDVVPSLALFRDGALVARKDGRLMRGLSREEMEGFLNRVLPARDAA